MKRSLKWIAIVVAVLFVIVVALPFLINVNSFRPQIESNLTDALGRKVTVGNVSLSILSGSVGADDIAIADDPSFSSTPFIRAKALKVGVELMPLIFSKQLHVTELSLEQPQVVLVRDSAGHWNFSTLGGKAAAKPADTRSSVPQGLSVGKLTIKEGQVSIAEGKGATKNHVYQNVDVSVKDFSFTSQFPFTLSADLPGGGTLKLDGTAGPINPNDAAVTPVQAKVEVKKLDLAKSGFVDPGTGFGGVADFDGTVNSDRHMAHSNGDMTGDSLKLSPKGSPAKSSVKVHYATDYDLQKQTGQLTQADVSVGKAIAKLRGTFDLHGDLAVLNMKLNADNMPVDDLVPMLPALAVTLPSGSSLQGGTLSADFSIVGPGDKLVITGPVKLINTKLTGFDMASKLAAITSLGAAKTGPDTAIQNLSADVHVAPSGIQTQNINLVVPSLGTVTGSGTVSPQNALDYKMSASLSGGLGGGLTTLASGGGKGGIPFFIQGTSSDPKFVPDVKGMAVGQLGKFGGQIPGGQSTQGITNAVGGLFGKKKKQ